MTSDPSQTAQEPLSTSGVGLAVACYSLWGVTPVYWKGIVSVPALEALTPRIVWTAILLLLVARLAGRQAETWQTDRKQLGWTLASALLLSANWAGFIYAVQTDQVIATSLGYYINPLASIILGMLVLGERLTWIQGLAVLIAAAGVVVLTIQAGTLPWISLGLASSFALYGLLHKLAPQPPFAGLTREMLILSPLAFLGIGWLAANGDSRLTEASLGTHAYLSLSSIITAAPLLLFHAATRRLPLIAVGMFQYIAPTLSLLLAVIVYREPFTPVHAAGFGFVWVGLAIFTFESVLRARGRVLPV